MLEVSGLQLQFGDRVLFDGVSFALGAQERAGLVGRNGAGKTTLLRIIAGEMSPDAGKVHRPAGSTLGFLHQEMELEGGRSVMEETLRAFEEAKALERRLHKMERQIQTRTDYQSPEYQKLLDDYSSAGERFALLGGNEMEARAGRVLRGLGFRQEDFQRPTETFSGGWQMRIELAKMLLRQPDILLLDEPTNHLDIESIIWLENYLCDYPGTVIVISHDKAFLDKVTTRTLEIELGKLYDYKAAYSQYRELRRERKEKQLAAYKNQQKVIAQKERTIQRFMAKATKTRQAQSMQKQLDKMERIEIEAEDEAVMHLRFPPAPRSGEVVLEAKGLSKSYGRLEVLQGVEFSLVRGDRVAFVGQNGQGKSTLAKLLVGELEPSAGSVRLGHNVLIGYYAQNQSETLNPALTVLETMENHAPAEMRPRVRTILGAFLFSGEDQEKKVSVLSGGEKARLALACLLLRPFNLLVLDEPTNHLDMRSKEVLKQALLQYDGTLVVVSHDRDFLKGLTHRVVEFREHRLHTFLGDVEAFLQARAADSMRQIEFSSKSNSESASPARPASTPKLSFEERKKWRNEATRAERAIERLEAEIADL
ncbi:MAG: ABC transporter ATP-binding protein, partial [Bacteroidetes bacterium]